MTVIQTMVIQYQEKMRQKPTRGHAKHDIFSMITHLTLPGTLMPKVLSPNSKLQKTSSLYWGELLWAHHPAFGSKLVHTLTSFFSFAPLEFVNPVSGCVRWGWWGNPRDGFPGISTTHIIGTYLSHWPFRPMQLPRPPWCVFLPRKQTWHKR